jgi:hypothetical protein
LRGTKKRKDKKGKEKEIEKEGRNLGNWNEILFIKCIGIPTQPKPHGYCDLSYTKEKKTYVELCNSFDFYLVGGFVDI